MRLAFATVDVFTDRRFSGNPLAVVLDAGGLAAAQMQAIAAEFNLSETTFVLPPQNPANTAQVRIFTPRAEMPFAGHPNIGTAFVLARAGEICGNGDGMRFEEKAGLVAVDLLKEGATVVGARLVSPMPFSLGPQVDVELIAAAHSLSVDDIDIRRHRPRIASCGTPFILAELQSRDALTRAEARADFFHRAVAKLPATSIMIYTQVEENGVDICARMFSPHHGIAEDPATGSANVALVGLLAQLRPERDLTLSKTTLQGAEMGRPSLLHAEAIKTGGVVTTTSVGGRCVAVTSGFIDV